MCPGGYVVNASSEQGMTAVNGMSYHDRDSKVANSAIVVQVTPADYENDDVLSGVAFQRNLERKAYDRANGKIPIQKYGDFKRSVTGKDDTAHELDFEPVTARYVEVVIAGHDLPEDHSGFGNPAWIFVDEIEID